MVQDAARIRDKRRAPALASYDIMYEKDWAEERGYYM